MGHSSLEEVGCRVWTWGLVVSVAGGILGLGMDLDGDLDLGLGLVLVLGLCGPSPSSSLCAVLTA